MTWARAGTKALFALLASALWGNALLAQEPPAAAASEPAEASAGAVIIEGERIGPDTLDQLMQRFRDMLEEERTLAPMERPLAGGGLEVHTRYGRFCIAPLPTYIASSDLAGGLTLASRCAMF